MFWGEVAERSPPKSDRNLNHPPSFSPNLLDFLGRTSEQTGVFIETVEMWRVEPITKKEHILVGGFIPFEKY